MTGLLVYFAVGAALFVLAMMRLPGIVEATIPPGVKAAPYYGVVLVAAMVAWPLILVIKFAPAKWFLEGED